MANEEDVTPLTVIERFCDADAPAESCTVAVKLEVPATVGVPLMAPVLALSVRPAGSEPEVDQLYGGCPPLAEIVAE